MMHTRCQAHLVPTRQTCFIKYIVVIGCTEKQLLQGKHFCNHIARKNDTGVCRMCLRNLLDAGFISAPLPANLDRFLPGERIAESVVPTEMSLTAEILFWATSRCL
jgi:hypothetical protein